MELVAVATSVWDPGISAGDLFRPVPIKTSLKHRHLLERHCFWHGKWQRDVRVSLHDGQGPKQSVSDKKKQTRIGRNCLSRLGLPQYT